MDDSLLGHAPLAALSQALVSSGVAPAVALGWARRAAEGWEVCVGGANGDRSGDPARCFFDLASLTKPMTAFAFALSGIPRTTELGELLPEVQGTASARMACELLLAHRGGLEANLPLFAPLLTGGSVDRREALRAAADARREDAHGPCPPEGFPPIYSDLGYVLVGEALARHAGARDAGEVIEHAVVRRLGCGGELGTARALRDRDVDFDARVVPTEVVAFRGGEVRGVVHDENAWALTSSGGSGHAGIFGTASAVLRFGCAALDAMAGEGPLATNASWLVAERPGGSLRAGFDGKSAEGSTAGARAGPRTFGHLGFTGTSLWIDPDADAVVTLLSNRVCPTRDNVRIRAARPETHDALFALAARTV